jgi:hypothetical protein
MVRMRSLSIARVKVREQTDSNQADERPALVNAITLRDEETQ